jgi:hypothetical protein
MLGVGVLESLLLLVLLLSPGSTSRLFFLVIRIRFLFFSYTFFSTSLLSLSDRNVAWCSGLGAPGKIAVKVEIPLSYILAARIFTSCIAYGSGLPPFAFGSWRYFVFWSLGYVGTNLNVLKE